MLSKKGLQDPIERIKALEEEITKEMNTDIRFFQKSPTSVRLATPSPLNHVEASETKLEFKTISQGK